MKNHSAALTALLVAALAAPWGTAEAQEQTYDACYVPEVGAMYLILLDDLPSDCLTEGHVRISWTEGGPAGASDHGDLEGLADDDHAQYLLADGVREAANGFAVSGSFDAGGTIPLEGAGARMMWYPDKAAFRAGSVNGEQWDDVNVGDYSTALGVDVQASATYSVALGRRATAATFGSVALGNIVEATGNNTLATNVGTQAQGDASTAMGHTTTASGFASMSMNLETLAEGRSSTAMGRETVAQPTNALAFGRWNAGVGNTTAWVSTDPLLMAGNGSSPSDRSNALTLYKNGDLTIAGTLTESSDLRLKREVEPIEDVLDALLGLRAVRYRFEEGSGHPQDVQIGLIAQEVEAAFPELVSRDADGYLSLAYPKLSAVLLKGVQEQQQAIDRHRAVLHHLSDRIQRLEQELDRMSAARARRPEG